MVDNITGDDLNSVARCSRYAFGPNRLHYCGPDASSEISYYMNSEAQHPRLQYLLRRFATLYPYLQTIATANHIRDPFDPRVVDAYWIGNKLLDAVSASQFYNLLKNTLQLPKRANAKATRSTYHKISLGALPHHSFHVLHIWRRTGHTATVHNLESIDKCRISWGKIIKIDGPFLTLKRRPIVLSGNTLDFGPATEYRVTRRLDDDGYFDEIKIGDWITIHWDFPCEIISKHKVINLEYYTKKSLRLVTPQLLECLNL